MKIVKRKYVLYNPKEDQYVRFRVITFRDIPELDFDHYDEIKETDGANMEFLQKLVRKELNFNYTPEVLDMLSSLMVIPIDVTIDVDNASAFKWDDI